MEERTLIEAAQNDPSRFDALYDANFARVYAFVARRVRDRHDAQDLTSEVFQQALANLGKFEWRGVPFAAWLFRIASNAIADHMKKRSREGEMAADEPAVDEDIERRAAVFESVDRLPHDQRRVIVARFAEGKSIREIAGEMQRSEGAIKQLQWRALQSLRAQMTHG